MQGRNIHLNTSIPPLEHLRDGTSYNPIGTTSTLSRPWEERTKNCCHANKGYSNHSKTNFITSR